MTNCSLGAPVYSTALDRQSKEQFYVFNSFSESIINRPCIFPPLDSLVCFILFPKSSLGPKMKLSVELIILDLTAALKTEV